MYHCDFVIISYRVSVIELILWSVSVRFIVYLFIYIRPYQDDVIF